MDLARANGGRPTPQARRGSVACLARQQPSRRLAREGRALASRSGHVGRCLAAAARALVAGSRRSGGRVPGGNVSRREARRVLLHAAGRSQPHRDPSGRRRERRCASADRGRRDARPGAHVVAERTTARLRRSASGVVRAPGHRRRDRRRAGHRVAVEPTSRSCGWHPDGTGLVAIRSARFGHDLVAVDAGGAEVALVAAGGAWGTPLWTADGSIVATYEDRGTPPELRLVRDREKKVALRTRSACRQEGSACRTQGSRLCLE